MPNNIDIITATGALPDDYSSYVQAHAGATFFHRKQWLACLESVYRYRLHCIMARDESGALVGVMPTMQVKSPLTSRRLIAAPFSYICPPLADDGQIQRELIEAARRWSESQRNKYIEIKTDMALEVGEEWRDYDGFKTYRLDLKRDIDTIWRGCHKSIIQRNVKKAEKEGVTVRRSSSMSDAALFDYLNRVTSRNHGIPPQPRVYFDYCWREFVMTGEADCYIAELNDKAIASIIVFYDKQRAIYMYGASLPEYLEVRPNHLLLWDAILHAHERGKPEFDFGRVSPDNTGLADFKLRWGTEAVPLHYYYWPPSDAIGAVDRTSLSFRLATATFSKLPIWLTGRLSFLYRHLA